MGLSVDWRDIKYQDTFEQELRGLERRRAQGNCAIADIEGVLQHLYQMDGADWAGRGEVQDITMAATIAAYERFIAQWKGEAPAP
ncbi:MAG: hypothetical protein LBD13_07460 [Spirochaetaceae bacterium]|jgi:hypothetical protein|nr:hypothetical protein [Spirochaetaceae bacterium]